MFSLNHFLKKTSNMGGGGLLKWNVCDFCKLCLYQTRIIQKYTKCNWKLGDKLKLKRRNVNLNNTKDLTHLFCRLGLGWNETLHNSNRSLPLSWAAVFQDSNCSYLWSFAVRTLYLENFQFLWGVGVWYNPVDTASVKNKLGALSCFWAGVKAK